MFSILLGTASPDPIFQSSPERSNLVLVGKNIKLKWTFKLDKPSDLRQIRLFTYILGSKAKTTIAKMDIESGKFQYNPFIKGYKGRFLCEVFFSKKGIGNASILIRNAQFNQTRDYGIILKTRNSTQHLPRRENSVSVRVVGKWV
jgi:hypothetical protein